MIAAAISGKMPFNWFDVMVALVLAFGFWRGRKNGMSRELLPLFYWLATILAAGFGYVWLGDFLMQQGIIKTMFSGTSYKQKTVAYVLSYLVIAALVRGAYSFVKKPFKEKVQASNLFGSIEYYLGMVSGVARYGCVVVSVLALVHAPVYSAADLEAERIYNNRVYGGGMQGYSGNFLPSMSEFQALVFKDSFVGPVLENSLHVLLINAGGASASARPPAMEFK